MKLEEIPSTRIHNMAGSKIVERSCQLQTSNDDQELIDYLLHTVQDLHAQLQNKSGSNVSRGELEDLHVECLCLQVHLSRSEAEKRRLQEENNCLRTSLNTLTSNHKENMAYLEQQMKFEKDQVRKERELTQQKMNELEEELNAVRYELQQEYDRSGLGGRMSCGSHVYNPARETACNVSTQCNNRRDNKVYQTSVRFDCMDHLRGAYLARGTKLSSEDHEIHQDGVSAHEPLFLNKLEDNLPWRELNSKEERTLQPYNNGVINRHIKSKDDKANKNLQNSSQNVINAPDLPSLASNDPFSNSVPIVQKRPSSLIIYTRDAVYSPNIKANVISSDSTTQQALAYNIIKPAPKTPSNYPNTCIQPLNLDTSEMKCNWGSTSSLNSDSSSPVASPTDTAHITRIASKSEESLLPSSIDYNNLSESAALSSDNLKALTCIKNSNIECFPRNNGTYVPGDAFFMTKKNIGLNSEDFNKFRMGITQNTQTRRTCFQNYKKSLSDSSLNSLSASQIRGRVSLTNGKKASNSTSCSQYMTDVMDAQNKVNTNCIGCGKVFLPDEHLLLLDHFELCQKQ